MGHHHFWRELWLRIARFCSFLALLGSSLTLIFRSINDLSGQVIPGKFFYLENILVILSSLFFLLIRPDLSALNHQRCFDTFDQIERGPRERLEQIANLMDWPRYLKLGIASLDDLV